MSESSHVSSRQVVLIVVVVLGAVVLGTLFTLRFQGPRPGSKPTALGHDLPPGPPVIRTNVPGL